MSAAAPPPSPPGAPVLSRVPAPVLVVGGIVSVQVGAAIAVSIFDRVGPAGASLLRLALGSLILLAAVRPWRRRHDRRALRWAVLFGLTMGAMNVLFYQALDRLPLGPAVTIEFLGPVVVATIYSRRARDVGWAVLAFAGVVLLAAPWHADGLDALGVAFALGAAACWGIYIVVSERTGRLFTGADGVAIAMVPAALVAVGPSLAADPVDLLAPGVLIAGLAIGVLSTAVPYSLEFEALRRIPKATFGVLMSLEPAVAALAGLILLGETLVAREIVAMALVVAASVGATRSGAAPSDAAAPLDA